MAPNSPLKLSLRGLFAWVLLSIITIALVRPITQALVPLMEGVIDVLQSDYVAQLSVTGTNYDAQVLMSCTATHDIAYPDGRVLHFLRSVQCAYMGAIHALVPPVIFLMPVMAWPLLQRGEAAYRVVGALVLLPLIVALTTPPLLVGLADWTLHPGSANPNSSLLALLQPIAFVEMGGGWLIALIAAAVCLRFSRMLADRTDRGSSP